MEETAIYEVKNPLKEYLDSITVPEYYEARKQIIERCKISRQIFTHWKNGNSRVPELAKPIINEIAGKEIFIAEIP